ncbi:MAG: hypothetical protein LBI45_07940 [Bacteroidales bacterium]|jgi:hypothetical protein|nr:hypothetical protein [Bacteroidales bacterium]
MKKISKILEVLPLFCGLLISSSCDKDVKNPFIGTWRSSTTDYEEYTFESNNSFEVFFSDISATFTGIYYFDKLPDAINNSAIYRLTYQLGSQDVQIEKNVTFPNSRTMVMGNDTGGTTYHKQ